MITLLALLSAPLAQDPAAETSEAPPWRLVGAYDLADVQALDPETGTDWSWRPDAAMIESCGPAKAPDGMGVFDAEAMGWGLTPTLALVLERQEGAQPGLLTNQQVRVAVGKDRPQFLLQPATLPRSIAVQLEGASTAFEESEAATWQVIRRQLEMLLCLEHKVGRGWIGGSEESVRQAILLAPPESDERGRHLPDRKFFGGQLASVPVLLGPPRACILGGSTPDPGALRGSSSVDLVPADLWGASLGRCPSDLVVGDRVGSARDQLILPIEGGDGGARLDQRRDLTWARMTVSVAREEGQSCIQSRWLDGEVDTVLIEQCVADDAADGAAMELEALPDLLAQVPLRYPALGTGDNPDRYTLLLIPNWQLVEAVAEMERPGKRLAPADAVTWLLDHPEHLFVQVQPDGQAFTSWAPGATAIELTGGLGHGWSDFQRRWGYMTGLLAGREPVIITGEAPPTWAQVRKAQRAEAHATVLAGSVMLLFAVLAGLSRLAELWRRIPEERAAYWPGRPEDLEGAGASDPDGPGTTVVPGGSS